MLKFILMLLAVALFSLNGCNRKTAAVAEVPVQKNAQKVAEYQNKKTAADREAMKVQTFEQKLELMNYKLLYDNGYQKHNEGDFKGAIADFDRCIQINNTFPDAFNFRGMSKFKSGDVQGACADWRKAVELGVGAAQQMINENCR